MIEEKNMEDHCFAETIEGRAFYPLRPELTTLTAEEVAASLSKLCRFGGHCLRFYSVAEHSVLLTRWAKERLLVEDVHLRSVLMHDASEVAIGGDIMSPFKDEVPVIRELEGKFMGPLSEALGFMYPLPPFIKQIDARIVVDERAQVMPASGRHWPKTDGLEPLGVRLRCWPPEVAFVKFMREWERLS